MVEITVDTKRDSKEDIKRVIEFLEKFVSLEYEGVKEGTFNMFGKAETEEKPREKFKPILY